MSGALAVTLAAMYICLASLSLPKAYKNAWFINHWALATTPQQTCPATFSNRFWHAKGERFSKDSATRAQFSGSVFCTTVRSLSSSVDDHSLAIFETTMAFFLDLGLRDTEIGALGFGIRSNSCETFDRGAAGGGKRNDPDVFCRLKLVMAVFHTHHINKS
jgi:hypothetical protein